MNPRPDEIYRGIVELGLCMVLIAVGGSFQDFIAGGLSVFAVRSVIMGITGEKSP